MNIPLKPVMNLTACLPWALFALAVSAAPPGSLDDSHIGFEGQVYDFAFLPNGHMLVAETDPNWMGPNDGLNHRIVEIGRRGRETVTGISAMISPINGLEPVGRGTFWATSGGMDLTFGAGLWRISRGNVRFVADISAFFLGDWPEGEPGPHPEWKDFRCEEFANFSHGPQVNPYHLTALSGSEVLIGDAAGNSVLWADIDGNIEVVAFMDPATDPDTGEWMALGLVNDQGEIDPIGGSIECYVEPVPTAVAIGPDGAWYVSDMIGATPMNFVGEPTPRGLSRIWRIEPGTRNATCPSDACTRVEFNEDVELNAIIDIEFGPDGKLYLVEFEKSGFLAVVAPGLDIPLAGGAVKRCDVDTGECDRLDDGVPFLPLPGAIAFDKWNDLWLLENVFDPTIRKIDWR